MEPPSEWRLMTAGGIRHRLISQRGGFSEENADWIMEIIIQATDLASFATEVFPQPTFGLGGIVYPRRFYPAGLPALRATRLEVEGFTSGRPIDPFDVDDTAPSGTYEPYLKATISFGTCPEGDTPDPNDPLTFLEISSQASGEFLTAEANGDGILWERGPLSDLPDETDTGLQQQVTVSLIEHTCKWNQIDYSWYDSTLLPRLRQMAGKVNSTPMVILNNAPAETILLDTWSKQQQFTWRDGYAGSNPISLEIKFVEKNFKDAEDEQITHNYTWRPNKGWWKLVVDGNYLYDSDDLNTLFQP